jgi:hypothetical protein
MTALTDPLGLNMNRFLKIFSKENKEEKEAANLFFETSLEQQLVSDKIFFAADGMSLVKPSGSETGFSFKENIPFVCQKFIQFFNSQSNFSYHL